MPNCTFQSKIIGLLLLSVFFSLLLSSNVIAQQNNIVEALDIQGNRRMTDEEILCHIKTRPGERFEAKKAQDDLQSLLKLGLFDDSQTRVATEVGVRGGLNVVFLIMELPLIVELDFDGLRHVTKDELLAELREQKADVTANSSYQPEKLRIARQKITEYLVEKRGFIKAKVSVTTEDISATTLKISFIIDEMPNDDDDEN